MKILNYIPLLFLSLSLSCSQQSKEENTMITKNINTVIDEYHKALNVFLGGDKEPVKQLYSHKDDVTLASPFGPTILGWKKVSEGIDYHVTRFKEGKQISAERIATYESAELVTIMEKEHFQAKIGGRDEKSEVYLRVTTTFRLEDKEWKLVSRHADPINSFNEDGPIRKEK